MRVLDFLTLLIAITLASAEDVPLGGPCSTALTRLDPITHKMMSDCDSKFFCNNGTCVNKGCRLYENDTIYDAGDSVPSFCPRGTYCPDAQDACKSVLAVGSPCELDRDEECGPAPGLNTSSSTICLQQVCRPANVGFNQTCIIEDTQYTAPSLSGIQMTVTVTRDDCRRPDFYCDRSALTCQYMKVLDQICDEDRECASGSCKSKKLCSLAPEAPIPLGPLGYSITATAIVTFIAIVFTTLVIIHRRQRAERQRERNEYFQEQTTFRNSIMDLHAAARTRAKQY